MFVPVTARSARCSGIGSLVIDGSFIRKPSHCGTGRAVLASRKPPNSGLTGVHIHPTRVASRPALGQRWRLCQPNVGASSLDVFVSAAVRRSWILELPSERDSIGSNLSGPEGSPCTLSREDTRVSGRDGLTPTSSRSPMPQPEHVELAVPAPASTDSSSRHPSRPLDF
jgi:hypothetical protein